MYEKRVAHFGNGIRLLEYEMGSPDWLDKYGKSKYASFPLYGDVHAGKLFLQDHASTVWYRNIKIRALTEDPWTDQDFAWPDQGTGISQGSRCQGCLPGLQIVRLDRGRIQLRPSSSMEWDLGLEDASGRRLGSLRGAGSVGELGLPELRPGTYFLSGSGTAADTPGVCPTSPRLRNPSLSFLGFAILWTPSRKSAQG